MTSLVGAGCHMTREVTLPEGQPQGRWAWSQRAQLLPAWPTPQNWAARGSVMGAVTGATTCSGAGLSTRGSSGLRACWEEGKAAQMVLVSAEATSPPPCGAQWPRPACLGAHGRAALTCGASTVQACMGLTPPNSDCRLCLQLLMPGPGVQSGWPGGLYS